MTRQQYQQKYGTSPTPSVSQQPIQMTRAEYDQKYGKKSVGGFVGNVVKSGGKLIGDTVGAIANIFNPNMEKNTIANVAKLSTGVAQLADPTQGNKIVSKIPGLAQVQGKFGDQEQTARNVGQFYKQRYGGVQNIKDTLYNDPVGMLADVGTVVTGVGGALRGAGGVASKLGSVSKASKLTQAGELASNIGTKIDPLVIAGKGLGKAGGFLRTKTNPALRNISDTLGAKAQKFNKTDIKAIKEATGTDPLTFARREGLPIAATKKSVGITEKATKVLQDQYNAMVRTGNKVSRKDYAQAIKNQADELLARADTPEVRSLAKQLYEEAQYQLKQKSKYMTDEFLTNTKTAAFTGASKNQLSNPLISGREEQLGRAGVEALESYAPGSKDLGKKLRGYKTYSEKLDSQANTGKGTQLFNMFKPAGAGLLAGAGAGSFLPGIGNITGAVGGAVLATLVNSPRFLAKASDILYNASKTGGKSIGLTATQKGVLLKMYNAGRAGRVFNPSDQESPIVGTILSMPEFQEEIPYSEYTPKSDLLDQIAEKQGLDVAEMRKKRLNFRR